MEREEIIGKILFGYKREAEDAVFDLVKFIAGYRGPFTSISGEVRMRCEDIIAKIVKYESKMEQVEKIGVDDGEVAAIRAVESK